MAPGSGEGVCHLMLFVRELLTCELLPADAPLLSPALRTFLIGKPPRPLHRLRCLGTVVRRAVVTVAGSGVETVIYLDDGSGVIPAVLPRSVSGTPAPAGPSVAWVCDPAGPEVGEVVEVFGTIQVGAHPALAEVDVAQRYVSVVSWVREGNPLQESYRALQIQQLYREQYFRDGLSGLGIAQRAPIAPPRTQTASDLGRAPLPAPQPPQPKRPQASAAMLSEDAVIEFLRGSGGGATREQLHQWHRKRLGCPPSAGQAGQLLACLTSLQESFAIYEDGNGRYCPM